MSCSFVVKSWAVLLAGLFGTSCLGIEPAVIEATDEPTSTSESTDPMRLTVVSADGADCDAYEI